MWILAIDTTAAFGSIALLEDDFVIEEIPLHSPEGFSTVLFDHIRRPLSRHGLTVDSIDCFASASGPGSFTGVRVGLAAVKGLAEATGKVAIGVSNLQALAASGRGALRAVVMDARRGEVYGAVYDAGLRVVTPESVLPFQAWMESLPAEVAEVVSPDFSMFRPHFTRDLPVIEQRALAANIGRIAYRRMVTGDLADTAALDANYVRRSDAEMNWVDR